MARRWHHAVLTATALLPLAVAPAFAGPNGATVAGGAATVQGQGTANVVVNQTSQNAIINWRTFNIGSGETTKIFMPGSNSTQLDRVTGGQGPSQILGTLYSNGKVFLVNPDGILFGMGASINVGSLLATTNDIANKDFMAGRYNFTIPGNPNASIVNMGTITAQTGGFAALVAPGVRNTGTITAKLGTISLASGNVFTLDMYGDNLITLGLTDSVASQVVDVSTGRPLNSLIKNEGTLKADGGTVTLTAAAARQVVDSVINNTGVIEANSIGSRNGMIVLGAATAGSKPAGAPTQTVKLSGTLSAKGNGTGTTGGTIIVTGENIAVSGARIDASGDAGGGKVLIGGDWGGGHPNTNLVSNGSASLEPYGTPNANTVSIDAATMIDASATGAGNGGKVIVWADQATTFLGTILAKGGAQSGNGGFVETSSHGVLDYAGVVDVRAPAGTTGTLLLDPYDVTICQTDCGENISNSGNVFSPTGSPSYLQASTLEAALSTANVIVTTGGVGSAGTDAGNINVNASLSWNANTGVGTLTLDAYNNININAAISSASGGLTLSAGNTIFANADVNVGTFTLQKGAWNQVNPTLPTFSANNFVISGGSFLRASGGDGSSGTPYQIVDVYGLQGIGTMLSSKYVLANAIDASGTVSWNGGAGFIPIGDSQSPFTGSLNGDGFAINNLTINSSAAYVGLFGMIGPGGSVQNLGIGSISLMATRWNGSGGDYAHVGALAGLNQGTISDSYATGMITSSSPYVTAPDTGGLVGTNAGSISQSYASVKITENSPGDSLYLGGLVGWNQVGGSITQSYATGIVTNNAGSNAEVGGFIGFNSGTVSQSYSMGAVSGLGGLGGLIGSGSGSVTSSYWDTQTSGQPVNADSIGTGLTTAQFQSGLPGGFDATGWGINPNLNNGHPYLLWQLPSGTQVVDGYVYTDGGITLAGNGIVVSALVNGVSLASLGGTVTTGANGSYNFLLPPGTILASGSQVLTYTTGANAGAAYRQNATGSVTNLNIYEGYLNETGGATTLSGLSAGLATALGGNTSVVNSLANRAINATGASFAIDQSLNAGTLLLSANGAVTQSAPLNVTNLALLGGSASFTLTNGANQVGTLAANAGNVSFADSTNLNIGTVNGTSGVTASGALTLNVNGGIGATAAVNVGTFTLANGNWSQDTASLPSFTAQNFVISGGSFLRAAGGGNGSPYQIADVYGLQGIGSSATLLADNYVLANSINASGTANWNGGAGFAPIGNGTTNFTGTFNGNGNSVSSLNIAPTNPNVTTIGLFGTIGSGGTVENLALSNISITANPNASSSGQSVGALAGENAGSISGVTADGSINGGAIVNVQLGGLVGQNDPGAHITNSQAHVNVTSTASLSLGNNNCSGSGTCDSINIGGFVGANFGSISGTTWTSAPTNCAASYACASGTVSVGALGSGGGFVGMNQGIISYAFATGNVTGAAGLPSSGGQAFNNLTTIGGFAGDNQGQIANTAAAGAVGNAGTMWLAAGGLAGSNEGTITSSSATGAVTTGDNSTVGGFVGGNSPDSGMQNCQGCLFGDGFNNSASISNSQASGTVTAGASSVAGGFAATGSQDNGSHGGSFTNITASGAVNAGHDSVVGGLVGVLLEDGTIANSTAHNSIVASSGPNSIIGGVVGLNEGTISGTASTAPVSGTSDSYIGGITGINLGLVTGSSTDPNIGGSGGNDFIGGIAGLNAGSINGSTANIALSGGSPNYSGGIAGVNGSFSNEPSAFPYSSFPNGTISNSSATGSGFTGQTGTSSPAWTPSLPAWLASCDDAGCGFVTGGTLQTASATNNIPANTIDVIQQVAQFTQPVNFTGPSTPPPLVNTASLNSETGNSANGAGNPANGTTGSTGGGSLASGLHGGNGAPSGMRLIDMPVMPLPPGSGLPPSGETRFLINKVVLQFGPEVSPQQVADIARRLGLVIVSQQTIAALRRTVYTFRITGGQSVAEIIRQVESGGVHVAAQPNYTYGLSQDPSVAGGRGDPAQYIVQKLQLGAAHRITEGKNIVIALIDSQVDPRQPDFAGRIVDSYDAGCGPNTPPDAHGTGMAGAIASHIGLLGVAPNARIIAICAFGGHGTPEATSTKIIRGVDYAIAHGAKIINMSFAGPHDPALAQELQIAREKGILIIAAAGNAGAKSPPLYPGADPNVMAVTATDEHDRLFNGANQGSYVAVAAPGVNILVPAPNGDVQFTTGTSVASANVSGVAALLLAEKPTRTPEEIRAILASTAKHLGAKGMNPQFGAGLVDPLKALRFVPTALGRKPTAEAAAPLRLH